MTAVNAVIIQQSFDTHVCSSDSAKNMSGNKDKDQPSKLYIG